MPPVSGRVGESRHLEKIAEESCLFLAGALSGGRRHCSAARKTDAVAQVVTSRARRQETKTGGGARFYLGGAESTGDPGERVTKQRGMSGEALTVVFESRPELTENCTDQ